MFYSPFTYLKLLSFFTITIFLFSCEQHQPVAKNFDTEIKPVKHDPHKLPKFAKLEKERSILDRMEQEWEMTRDVNTGEIPANELKKAMKLKNAQLNELIQKTAIPNVAWSERGPNNVGGRTRAIMFDPNDATAKKVWAGGVGGGLWYTNDITVTNAVWTKVDDFWSNMAVTSIAHDPVDKDVFYVGTGEGFYNGGSQNGDGIWKSTDGGVNWTQLSNTSNFNMCNKIVTWKANHVVVATNSGLQISTDAGATWTNAWSNYRLLDVESSVNGDLYAGTDGGDVWKSVDDGVTWTYAYNGSKSRVEIATAPSDNNVVYALINDGANSNNVNEILRSSDGGTNWTSMSIPMYKNQNCSYSSTPFTRGQGWYDLISIVDPSDANSIIVGGIDLHRSQDGGSTWETISYWTGGSCDAEVHADQHALVSRPGYPNAILSGNDGGIYYSPNAFTNNSNPTFNKQVDGYNVTQFYSVGLHPSAGSNVFLAGAQDNGSQRFSSAGIGNTYEVTGGDGAFCHIDQTVGNIQISSYVYNNYRYTNTGANSYSYVDIANDGRFINPTDYDNTSNTLYCAASSGVYRWLKGFATGSITHGTVTVSDFGGQVSCVQVSPNTADRVFFGVGNGKIVRVDNAGSSPTSTNLGAPQSGYVSDIAVEEGNDNHLIVVYSNYNLNSVYESTDGGSSWTSIEGDLPNMPVRSVIFNPSNADQAIIGTEIGVWTTDNINGSSTDWDPSNSGLSNTRIDDVQYRTSDKLVAAATHGRGLFTSSSFNGQEACQICDVSIGEQTCDPATGKYTQSISMTLKETPAAGEIVVNGQYFPYPYNVASTSQTYTLTNLTPNGASVNLDIHYQSFPNINADIVNAWTAPATGCAGFNTICSKAFAINGNGTITSDGPSSGNGATNSPATNADWYTFTPTVNGDFSIESCEQGVDTRIFIYSGTCNSMTQIATSDDDCPISPGSSSNYASKIENVALTAGTKYFIEWDNRWSTDGFDFETTFSGGCTVSDKLFVDPSATENGAGCSWNTAYKYLQDAIAYAAGNSQITEIWLKAGLHTPGTSAEVPTRYSTFETTEALTIYGGFDGTETQLSERDIVNNISILSGDIGVVNSNVDNVYNIITHRTTNLLTLDGLTIQDGNETSGNNWSGAGIWNTGTISLKDCMLKNNAATSEGSAIYNRLSGAIMTLENTTCKDNMGVDFYNSGQLILIGSENMFEE